jgi:hypothetical protein
VYPVTPKTDSKGPMHCRTIGTSSAIINNIRSVYSYYCVLRGPYPKTAFVLPVFLGGGGGASILRVNFMGGGGGFVRIPHRAPVVVKSFVYCSKCRHLEINAPLFSCQTQTNIILSM